MAAVILRVRQIYRPETEGDGRSGHANRSQRNKERFVYWMRGIRVVGQHSDTMICPY